MEWLLAAVAAVIIGVFVLGAVRAAGVPRSKSGTDGGGDDGGGRPPEG